MFTNALYLRRREKGSEKDDEEPHHYEELPQELEVSAPSQLNYLELKGQSPDHVYQDI